jgi:tetratricopeptide (TPR) repeat protein
MLRIFPYRREFICALLLVGLAAAAPSRSSQLHWIRVSSSHFSVLTDAGQKKGTEAILRFEQMRAVFGSLLLRSRLTLSEPLEIVAFKNREEYVQIAPLHGEQPISSSAFYLPGEDRNYVVLDLSDEESWRAVCSAMAHLWLSYNYPPTQAWFDEGFAEYYSSLRLDDTEAQIGGDPASLAASLSAQPWTAIPQLFVADSPSPLFQAESWLVIHYLLNHDKLSETGAYFDLAENQKLPVEQAIQQAYGMTAAQLEQAVRDYFHSIAPLLLARDAAKPTNAAGSTGPIRQFPAPVTAGDVGSSVRDVVDREALALLAEATLRLPEHREQAVKQLETLVNQPESDVAIAHRALAWAHLQVHKYDDAMEELAKAADLDRDDPWVRYYMALVKYVRARASEEPIQGQANMMVDLRAVLDWDPVFAEAYNMLAMARLEGGGINAATDSMRQAIALSPRRQSYLLNLAHIYLAAKKWESATALLVRLKESRDEQIAGTAQKDLEDLPSLKKYGIRTQRPASPQSAQRAQEQKPAQEEDSARADAPSISTEPEPDHRKVQYLKGKLVAVDCSQPPLATLHVAAGAKTMKLRTENYKTLLVIGADDFSCEWKNRSVVLNYKAGGKADGDLVSVEVQ